MNFLGPQYFTDLITSDQILCMTIKNEDTSIHFDDDDNDDDDDDDDNNNNNNNKAHRD